MSVPENSVNQSILRRRQSLPLSQKKQPSDKANRNRANNVPLPGKDSSKTSNSSVISVSRPSPTSASEEQKSKFEAFTSHISRMLGQVRSAIADSINNTYTNYSNRCERKALMKKLQCFSKEHRKSIESLCKAYPIVVKRINDHVGKLQKIGKQWEDENTSAENKKECLDEIFNKFKEEISLIKNNNDSDDSAIITERAMRFLVDTVPYQRSIPTVAKAQRRALSTLSHLPQKDLKTFLEIQKKYPQLAIKVCQFIKGLDDVEKELENFVEENPEFKKLTTEEKKAALADKKSIEFIQGFMTFLQDDREKVDFIRKLNFHILNATTVQVIQEITDSLERAFVDYGSHLVTVSQYKTAEDAGNTAKNSELKRDNASKKETLSNLASLPYAEYVGAKYGFRKSQQLGIRYNPEFTPKKNKEGSVQSVAVCYKVYNEGSGRLCEKKFSINFNPHPTEEVSKELILLFKNPVCKLENLIQKINNTKEKDKIKLSNETKQYIQKNSKNLKQSLFTFTNESPVVISEVFGVASGLKEHESVSTQHLLAVTTPKNAKALIDLHALGFARPSLDSSMHFILDDDQLSMAFANFLYCKDPVKTMHQKSLTALIAYKYGIESKQLEVIEKFFVLHGNRHEVLYLHKIEHAQSLPKLELYELEELFNGNIHMVQALHKKYVEEFTLSEKQQKIFGVFPPNIKELLELCYVGYKDEF